MMKTSLYTHAYNIPLSTINSMAKCAIWVMIPQVTGTETYEIAKLSAISSLRANHAWYYHPNCTLRQYDE